MINAVFFFWAFAAFILIAYFYYKVVRTTPEESLALAVMTIPLVIFLPAYLGYAKIGIGVLAALSICGLLSVFLIRKGESKWKDFLLFLSPGVVALCGMIVVIYGLFHHCFICNFDELTQWAKAADYMLAKDLLPIGGEFEGYSTMFSTTTLFQYALNYLPYHITGVSVSGAYYTTSVLFWMVAILLPLSGRGWNKWRSTLLYVVTIFMITNWMYVHPYYNMYPDQAVSLWTGGFLGWYLYSPFANGKKKKVLSPIILGNIVFLKTMVGPLFVAVSVVTIWMDYLFVKKNEKKLGKQEVSSRSFVGKKFLKILVVVGAVGILVYVVLFSGDNFFLNHLFHIDTTNNRVPLTIKSGIKNAFLAVNLDQGFWNISYVGFFIASIILFLILRIFILPKQEKKRMTPIYITYILGFGLYFLVLIYAFLTVFGYADSVRTGSIYRYYSCYMLLGSIPLLAPFFLFPTKLHTKAHAIRRIVAILIVVVSIGVSSVAFVGDICPDFNQERTFLKLKDISYYKKQIDEVTHGKGKIYMINQSRAIYYVVEADYQFKNQITRDGMCYYFPEKEKDIEGINVLEYHDISEFPSMLEVGDYDYVWIYKGDSYFREQFEKMFDYKKNTVKKGNIYKVIKKDGTVSLEFIKKIHQITRVLEE